MKNKEDEQNKFEDNKQLLLNLILPHVCPTLHSTMDMIPEYKQVKEDHDLIGTIKILQSICYANKDGGTTFNPFKNIKLRAKHLTYRMNKNKSACTYKEEIKTNFESSLSVVGCFPFGMCSLEHMLSESNLKWGDYLKMGNNNRAKWEKKANELDKSMMFIFGCENKEMGKDLKRMSAYNNEQYPRNIKTACHIYHTQYKKTKGKNNEKENNTNQKSSDDDDNDNTDDDGNGDKDGLISTHLTMENKSDDDGDESNDDSNKDRFVRVHLINNVADMLVVNGSWEPTTDDELELLVGEEDVMCCHLTMDPIEESVLK